MPKKDKNLPAETKSVSVDAFGQVAALLGVDTAAPAEDLLDLGIAEINRAERSLMRAGTCFIALKDRLPHGHFEQALEARGIPPRQAQRAMQIAATLSRLPEPMMQRLAQAPPSKLLAIARADDVVLQSLADSGDLERLDAVSVRELEAKVKKLEGKLAAEQTKRETAEATTERVKAKALNRLVDSQLPEFCVVAREESAALSEQMSLALDGLELLARDNLFMDHDEVADAERFAAMAAGTFFHGLRAIHARTGHLLRQLAETFPEVTDKVGFEHQLKPGELDAFKHARELVLGRIKVAASNREAERHNAKGGRGRPRDIKKVK